MPCFRCTYCSYSNTVVLNDESVNLTASQMVGSVNSSCAKDKKFEIDQLLFIGFSKKFYFTATLKRNQLWFRQRNKKTRLYQITLFCIPTSSKLRRLQNGSLYLYLLHFIKCLEKSQITLLCTAVCLQSMFVVLTHQRYNLN